MELSTAASFTAAAISLITDLANEVRFRVKDAVQAASPTITAEQHEQSRAIIAEARVRLLGSAKRDMALPR